MSYGNGPLLLKDAEALLECRTNQQVAVCDHGVVLLHTHTTQADIAIRPLALQRSRFHRHDCCRPRGGRGGEAPLPSENPLETA
jgi:flavin reductase (DIM6/NTAB) family NADH-FMN oxidoreductase RutF